MNIAEREELVKYRISRAIETLEEIEIHIDNKLWNTAVNRIYYACYYAVIALLIQHEIKTQTHAGVRQMFGKHFIKTGIISKEYGRFFSIVFDKRMDSDYDDFVVYSREEVSELHKEAKEFVTQLKSNINK